jgi:hypothetical protein
MTKVFQELTEENFELFAARYYSNPQCLDIKEFHDDVLKFKYVKKLLKRYAETGDLQERLILNHLIVLYNVFPSAIASRMLFFKLDSEFWPAAKTFLLYMNHIQPGTYTEIPVDLKVTNRLKTL